MGREVFKLFVHQNNSSGSKCEWRGESYVVHAVKCFITQDDFVLLHLQNNHEL